MQCFSTVSGALDLHPAAKQSHLATTKDSSCPTCGNTKKQLRNIYCQYCWQDIILILETQLIQSVI